MQIELVTLLRRSFFWLLVLAQMSIIFYLSTFSEFPKAVPLWMWGMDKVAHAGFFGALGLFFLNAWIDGRWREITFSPVIIAIVFTALYGMSDELHQSFVPNRTPALGDLAADTVGAILFCGAFYWFFRDRENNFNDF